MGNVNAAAKRNLICSFGTPHSIKKIKNKNREARKTKRLLKQRCLLCMFVRGLHNLLFLISFQPSCGW